MTFILKTTICLFLCLAVFTAEVLPMTTSSDVSYESINISQATGLFGGLKPDGTFVYWASKERGVRFYRVSPNVNILGFGNVTNLNLIPVETPVRIYTEGGSIVTVEALGEGQ